MLRYANQERQTVGSHRGRAFPVGLPTLNSNMLNNNQRRTIHIAALAVICGWALILVDVLILAGVFIFCLATGQSAEKVATQFAIIFLVCSFFFIFSGVIYFVLQFFVKCPNCGFLLLKNPQGVKNRELQYPSTVTLGSNRWSRQIVRSLRENRIQCLQCHRDYEIN